MEGVVRAPSEFSITLASLPSITATQEFVVPRSIPITLAILLLSYKQVAGTQCSAFRRNPRLDGFTTGAQASCRSGRCGVYKEGCFSLQGGRAAQTQLF